MKKIILLFCAVAAYSISFGQAIAGADMENWRTTTTGSTTPTSVMAPYGWYGADSVVIALGQSFGSLVGAADSDFHRNLFKETSITHGGSASAKIITLRQSTYLLPGVLSTAQTHVGITFTPPGITGISFSGGNAVSAKPTTVSAWVRYYPGIDSVTGHTGIDSGVLNVQALSHIGGIDSVIGVGAFVIAPSASWVQITANIVYTDTTHAIDTMRIAFSSSNTRTALDSSTLYVDDVTMTSIPNPVPVDHTGFKNVTANEAVTVYPNPVTGSLYFSASQGAISKAVLYAVNGQEVTSADISAYGAVDVSALPAGLYFYTVFDNAGNTVQRGKVSVSR